jgi:hypothetical protein
VDRRAVQRGVITLPAAHRQGMCERARARIHWKEAPHFGVVRANTPRRMATTPGQSAAAAAPSPPAVPSGGGTAPSIPACNAAVATAALPPASRHPHAPTRPPAATAAHVVTEQEAAFARELAALPESLLREVAYFL